MHGITNIFTKDENAIHNTEMRILENDLIPVYETNSGEKVVYGTELHAGLGSPSVYREWAKRRLSDVDAVENEDYTTVEIPTVSGGLPRKDHIIKLDTAKEMAMLERSEKGKQVRRYFIRVEKKYKEHIQEFVSEPLMLCLKGIKFIADDLKVAQSSRLLMYNGAFEEFGLPTSFLPKYEDNGSRTAFLCPCVSWLYIFITLASSSPCFFALYSSYCAFDSHPVNFSGVVPKASEIFLSISTSIFLMFPASYFWAVASVTPIFSPSSLRVIPASFLYFFMLFPTLTQN